MLKGIEFLRRKSREFNTLPRSLSSLLAQRSNDDRVIGEVDGLLRFTRNDDRQGEVGRSMIEMLGVLAIIAVLSVGGIAGYSKAMSNYKHDKWRQQVEELLFNTKDSYKNEKTYKSATGDVLSTLKTIGAVPQGMLDVTNRDLFGNTFSIYAEEWLSFLRIRMVVETMPSQDAVQVCQDLYGLLPVYNDFIWTIVAGCSSGNCGSLFFMRLCGNAMPADYFNRYGHECQNAIDKAYIAQSCTKCKDEKCFIWVFFDNRT